VHLKVGEPIETAGLTMADRDALMRRVRDRLIDLHLTIGGKGGDRTQAISPEGREGVSSYSLPSA
jgi:1-acyl-sn-glycerol-3-phosphate acyltransferase